MTCRRLLLVVLSACAPPKVGARGRMAQGAPEEAGPATVLFDTNSKSEGKALTTDAIDARKGWTAVSEDNLTHAFAGDAVFVNDRVAVVLRKISAGAEIYSRSHGASVQRVALLPVGADGAQSVMTSVKIIENSQAAVMMEAALAGNKGAMSTFRFRISAGEGLVEVRGAQGARSVLISDRAKYAVVPDFFADDMVYDPAALKGNRIGLPAENSLLGLTDDGRAIVTYIWPSSRQNAELILNEGQPRTIQGYQIDLAESNRLWIAVMEGEGIWHARQVTPSAGSSQAGAELALEWKPPMPARWRADIVDAGGMGVSASFADSEAGATTEGPRSDGRCRFDAGRPLVRMSDVAGVKSPHLIVVYPVERTRTTPLTAFCLVDIMRNALGVGPCQYVLDAERLGAADNPTPEQVTHWVQTQFEKKPSKRDADAIREQLTNMTLQVKRTDARIVDYVNFGLKVKQACSDYAKAPENAPAANRLVAIAESMITPPAAGFPTVEKLAAEVAAQAEQPDALAKSHASIIAIRAAGAAEDYALAKLRMAARRLKQESRTLAASDAKAAAFAGEIQQQAEQMLVKK